MRHFLLTRSVYGPTWSLDANRRRLSLLEGVTARSVAGQEGPWTWIVLTGVDDPLRRDREEVIRSACPGAIILPFAGPADIRAIDKAGIAFEGYRAPWAEAIGDRDDRVLMTRLDDDDAFAPDAFARLHRAAAAAPPRRIAFIFPEGIRVWKGRFDRVRHESNAMATLMTPPGDHLTVYGYGHTKVRDVATVRFIDDRPGWLWVRHGDTISAWKRASHPLTPRIKANFPVNWSAIERAWAAEA